MRFNALCTCRRVDSQKSRSPEVIWDHPSFGRTRGGNPSSSGEGALGGTSAQKVETPEARRAEGPRAVDLQRDTCQ
jgi:hypothetical protein